MGHKIFVSYKYADYDVADRSPYEHSKVRDYVDEFESLLGSTDHIYKGEHDGDDLSQLSDETIWKKLKDRIYDSTLTIVFISPGMKEPWKSERDQWIPWEISYSLKETSRTNGSGDTVYCRSNAMIAVVLPDSSGRYGYYLESKDCCSSTCIMHHTNRLFEIMRKNMFNKNDGRKKTCNLGDTVWTGECSYIEAVKWSDFIKDASLYIDRSFNRRERIDEFDITKEIT